MEKEIANVKMLEANMQACAYNAAVNYGSGRAHKKMLGLIDALNALMRAEGKLKMKRLIKAGIIENYTPCSDECCMRPGGLFHAEGCENEMNHPTYKERAEKARQQIPAGAEGGGGYWAASVSLVGK